MSDPVAVLTRAEAVEMVRAMQHLRRTADEMAARMEALLVYLDSARVPPAQATPPALPFRSRRAAAK